MPATCKVLGSFDYPPPLPFLSPPLLFELLEAVDIIEPLESTLFDRFLSSYI
jgi:hypothetical protein